MIKQLNLDWDSLDDCQSMLGVIKVRLGELRKANDPTYLSKNQRVAQVFDACTTIINTDISNIYKDVTLDERRIYYVYAHCDPGFKIALKKEGKSTFGATLGMVYMPFYIGKGTGDRAYDLNRNDSHRKMKQKIKTFNQDVDVRILRDGLSEIEALMLESKLIDIFGLKSQGGRLVNLDEGINSSERRQLYVNSLHKLSDFYKNSV